MSRRQRRRRRPLCAQKVSSSSLDLSTFCFVTFCFSSRRLVLLLALRMACGTSRAYVLRNESRRVGRGRGWGATSSVAVGQNLVFRCQYPCYVMYRNTLSCFRPPTRPSPSASPSFHRFRSFEFSALRTSLKAPASTATIAMATAHTLMPLT
jgi:hypothetical protein